MKREFLQNLKIGEQGLPKEMIDAIMAENGKDIQAAREALYEGKTAQQWKQAHDQAVQAHTKAIEAMQFQNLLDGAITAAGGRSVKAICALLDVEGLRGSDDPQTQVKAALEELKKESGYLFREEQLPPAYAFATGTAGGEKNDRNNSLAGALREKFERK